jgi:hypothetical protein
VGDAVYEVTVASTGLWSIDLSTATPDSGSFAGLAPGNNSVDLVSTDTAGNATSGDTAQVTYADLSAPNAPTVAATLTNQFTPTLTGTADAFSTVHVALGGATYVVMADSNGDWSLNTAATAPAEGSLSLAQGPNSVSVYATDSGNNSSATVSGTVTLDTVYTPLTLATTSTNATEPLLSGTAEAGTTLSVKLTQDGTTYTTYTVEVGGNGAWSLNLASATPASGSAVTYANGQWPVRILSSDLAGNTIERTFPLTVNTAAPTPATGPAILGVRDDSGLLEDTGMGPSTADTTPTWFGTGTAGSTVYVSL